MNTKKATKRALLTSVTALVMCVVMLVGTTFAWFTDTASTGVNKIQAGNLKVDIIGANSEAHLEKLNFTKKVDTLTDGSAAEVTPAADILWEPGCRYVTEGFRIANKGNLALKWKAQVNKGTTVANEGNFDLLDVIDFYLVKNDKNDEGTRLDEFTGTLEAKKTSEDVYYIKGVMQTTAGNDYQNLTLDGITITVYATQDTVENDSFDNTYDQGATYPVSTADLLATYGNDGIKMPAGVVIASRDNQGNVTVTLKDEEAFLYFTQVFDMDAARAARETALADGTATRYPGESVHNNYNIWYRAYGQVHVELACDVDLQNRMVTPFTECRTFDGKGHTIKNATVVGDGKSVGFFGNFDVTNVKMDNIHVKADGDQYAGVISGYNQYAISKVTVTNSTVTGGKNTGAIVGNCYVDLENCVVENCVISGQYKVGGLAGYVCREDGQKRIINNNSLKNVTLKGANLISGKSDYVIGQVVGNWNARSGGECKGNIITNVTGAANAIGKVESDVTSPQQ